jgi:hypothetical protein
MENETKNKIDRLMEDLTIYETEAPNGRRPLVTQTFGNQWRILTIRGNVTTVDWMEAPLPEGVLGATRLCGSRASMAFTPSLAEREDRVVVGVFCSQLAHVITGSAFEGLLWRHWCSELVRRFRWIWSEYGFRTPLNDVPYTGRALRKALKGEK